MRYRGNLQVIIQEMAQISGTFDALTDDYKKQQESKKGALEKQYEQQKYYFLNLSYLKMTNLFKSTLRLTLEEYPDEARILLRSFFELFITFKYVFPENVDFQAYRLKRYFDYIKLVAPFNHTFKTKNIYCNIPKDIKNNQDLCKTVLEEFKENDIENKINKFKSLYSIRNNSELNNWYGCPFDNIFRQLDFNPNFKKIYNWYCLFTHNVVMNYYNGDAFTDRPSPEAILEALFILNTLYGLFLVEYYHIRKFDATILEESYLKPFTALNNKYDIGV